MTLKTRLAKLEAQAGDEGKYTLPGAVLIVGDPHDLTEAEVARLAEIQTQVRPGGTVVLLPDNRRQ